MTKIHAFGTELAWDPAGGSAYTAIGQVTSISGPGLARETVDVTTHDNMDMWRSFIKSLKDGGEVSFDILYDPVLGTHNYSTGLLSDFADDSTIANFRLTFPDAGTTEWTFPGIVTGFETAEPIDDALKATITIKCSGTPTLT
jgi:predicted secreted protein